MSVILILILCMASISDIRSHTVPLYLWAIPIISKILWVSLGHKGNLQDAFLIALIIFMFFCVISYWSGLGGADVLLFTSIAFVLEIYAIHAILLSFLYSLPYTFWLAMRRERREYAFVPYILAGTITACILTEVF